MNRVAAAALLLKPWTEEKRRGNLKIWKSAPFCWESISFRRQSAFLHAAKVCVIKNCELLISIYPQFQTFHQRFVNLLLPCRLSFQEKEKKKGENCLATCSHLHTSVQIVTWYISVIIFCESHGQFCWKSTLRLYNRQTFDPRADGKGRTENKYVLSAATFPLFFSYLDIPRDDQITVAGIKKNRSLEALYATADFAHLFGWEISLYSHTLLLMGLSMYIYDTYIRWRWKCCEFTLFSTLIPAYS